ncbi:MAG: hypothetical protein LAO07_20480 [Acidobacteriia bacterium]|nr:hypothetical protein [Terriglobia bacterium]
MHANRELNSNRFSLVVLRSSSLAGAVSICVLGLSSLAIFTLRAQTPDVPVVKADVGPCSADFTVTNGENKPIFDAKIQARLRYGFMSKRKTDVEVGTNSDGKARVEGLPDKAKKPLEFRVRHGAFLKVVTQDPGTDCHANFPVVLAAQ